MANGEGCGPGEPIDASEEGTCPYAISLVARSAVKATGRRKRKATFVRILSVRLTLYGEKSNVPDTQKRLG